MRAVCWRGKHEVAVESVPDPHLINPRDAIVKVSLTIVRPMLFQVSCSVDGLRGIRLIAYCSQSKLVRISLKMLQPWLRLSNGLRMTSPAL